MRIAKKTFAALIGLALLAGVSSSADAIPFTYNYQSPNYDPNNVFGVYDDGVVRSMTGTFTIDVPDNTSLAGGDKTGVLTAADFTDGINSFGLADVTAFAFGTDAFGDILIDADLDIQFASGDSGMFLGLLPANDFVVFGPLGEDSAEAIEVGTFSQATAPEPGVIALLGAGLLGLALFRRRQSLQRQSA